MAACEAVSNETMTMAQSRIMKQWRLEHVGLEDDPQQPVLDY
jgi:hypothetical protein